MNTIEQYIASSPWDDPAETPFISFKNVTKRFGSFTAVNNIDLNIYKGEFFALLGPSGCGKTTLMRMLGGFENLSDGAIKIDGQDMAGIPPNRRPVNMMFQSYALFPHLTVEENIAFGLKRDKLPKADITARVDEMINLVQLNKFAKRKPHQISGGQKQRVALARSLAKAPKLLLLDEPLGALDKKLRQETQFELMDIQEKLGTTFVIVTHDQEEAMTVASRVALMDQGQFVQIDTPSNIYEMPQSSYVADFIGDINLINGAVASKNNENGIVSVNWAENQLPIRGATHQTFAGDQKCVFVIRPEKVSLSKTEPDKIANKFKGKILDIAYLGNMSTYNIELASGHLLKSQIANSRRLSKREFTWNDEVWVSWTETAGLVLDK